METNRERHDLYKRFKKAYLYIFSFPADAMVVVLSQDTVTTADTVATSDGAAGPPGTPRCPTTSTLSVETTSTTSAMSNLGIRPGAAADIGKLARLEMLKAMLRIDSCDQPRFWECSYIFGSRCMICKYYTSLGAPEFSLSYHMD